MDTLFKLKSIIKQRKKKIWLFVYCSQNTAGLLQFNSLPLPLFKYKTYNVNKQFTLATENASQIQILDK